VTTPERKASIRKILLFLGAAMGLVLVMLFMTGTFTPDRVGPGTRVPDPPKGPAPESTTMAEITVLTEAERSVGTVRPRTETRIEAQVTARVLEVRVRPGDRVDAGDLLIVLDGSQSQSRLDQARQGLQSATARRQQAAQAVLSARAVLSEAEASYHRVQTYFASEAATAQDLERAESAFLQARAGLEQAEQSLREVEAGERMAAKVIEETRIALEYNRIEAPEAGEVAERSAEPGDLAWPGKTLLVLQTRGALRLEAMVREGLIHRIAVGSRMEISVDVQDRTYEGVVEEVVPSADPVTRTFLVKVALPHAEELYPGMFGRLVIPVGERRVVTVLRNAVTRVGQLDMVTIRAGDRWQRVFVTTGQTIGDRVEILSGLNGGEVLALDGAVP